MIEDIENKIRSLVEMIAESKESVRLLEQEYLAKMQEGVKDDMHSTESRHTD